MIEKIWITWETQRRSIELSKALNCKLYIFDIEGIFRYPISIVKTLFVLFSKRPRLLFIQNPSMILATLACLYGKFTKVSVIVDRHTTFKLNQPQSGSLSIWIFMHLHYYTLRTADLTIVTNDFLADLVKKAKGNPVVLPDILPDITTTRTIKLQGKKNILLISSFGKDEPIDEVIDAAKLIPPDYHIYITGNYRKKYCSLPDLPLNVTLTGFIPESDFFAYLHSVDIVMALTTADYCMLCGCYEAVAAEKPLITSDKQVLRDYFKSAVIVDNKPESIANAVNTIIANEDSFKTNASLLKKDLEKEWSLLFNETNKKISQL